MKTGPAFPRTRRVQTDPMFSQALGSDYVEPSFKSRLYDVLVLLATIVVFGAMCVLGGVFYGTL